MQAVCSSTNYPSFFCSNIFCRTEIIVFKLSVISQKRTEFFVWERWFHKWLLNVEIQQSYTSEGRATPAKAQEYIRILRRNIFLERQNGKFSFHQIGQSRIEECIFLIASSTRRIRSTNHNSLEPPNRDMIYIIITGYGVKIFNYREASSRAFPRGWHMVYCLQVPSL
jgi:hypothetical protein